MNPLNVSSRIFDRNEASVKRIVANQGGTSSGKTWSILQLLLCRALEKKLHISVVAITLPHLKKGALRDFIAILNHAGIYDDVVHNKSENSFILGEHESYIEFFSVDEPGKARGPRRDVLFVNEVNLIPEPTFTQLALRTKDQIFVDYNPADENSWVYEHILTRPDCEFIQTTYLDNSFLDPEITKEIERLKDQDENLWKIYGLGERGQLKSLIYPVWDLIDNMPDESNMEVYYGLDFGYTHPAALVKCQSNERIVFVDEMIYQSGLDAVDIIDLLNSMISKTHPIFADGSRPEIIAAIRKAGFNCKPADKSVKDGIAAVRSCKITVTRRSTNLLKERAGYKYAEHANGQILEEPVKFRDDCMDALRMAIHSHFLMPSGQYSVSVL